MKRTINKRRASISALSIFVFVVMITLSLSGETISGQEIRVIRVDSQYKANDDIMIEPSFMMIHPGAVVIWWNKGKEKIKVVFMEGAKCDAGTGSPRGFHIESKSENCYITAYISSGETSSLRFVSEDIYEYEVRIDGKGKEKGRIVVAEKDIYL